MDVGTNENDIEEIERIASQCLGEREYNITDVSFLSVNSANYGTDSSFTTDLCNENIIEASSKELSPYLKYIPSMEMEDKISNNRECGDKEVGLCESRDTQLVPVAKYTSLYPSGIHSLVLRDLELKFKELQDQTLLKDLEVQKYKVLCKKTSTRVNSLKITLNKLEVDLETLKQVGKRSKEEISLLKEDSITTSQAIKCYQQNMHTLIDKLKLCKNKYLSLKESLHCRDLTIRELSGYKSEKTGIMKDVQRKFDVISKSIDNDKIDGFIENLNSQELVGYNNMSNVMNLINHQCNSFKKRLLNLPFSHISARMDDLSDFMINKNNNLNKNFAVKFPQHATNNFSLDSCTESAKSNESPSNDLERFLEEIEKDFMENRGLQNKLEDQRSQIDTMRRVISGLKIKEESSQQKLNSINDSMNYFKSALNKTKKEVIKIKKDFEIEKKTISNNFEDQFKVLKEVHTLHNEEKISLKSELQSMNVMKIELEKYKGGFASLEKKYNELLTENIKISEKYQNSMQVNNSMALVHRDQKGKVQSKIRELISELDSTKSHLQRLKDSELKLTRKTSEYKECISKNLCLENKLNEMEKRIKIERKAFSAKETTYKNDIVALKSIISKLRSKDKVSLLQKDEIQIPQSSENEYNDNEESSGDEILIDNSSFESCTQYRENKRKYIEISPDRSAMASKRNKN